MGFYVRLGRKRALWIECRRAWHAQRLRIERIKSEWLIALPLMQIIYTP